MDTNVLPIVKPDPEQMLSHVRHLFGGFLDGCHEGKIELAWSDQGDGKLRHAAIFGTDELEELVEKAVLENSKPGQNVYIGQAIRKPDIPPFGRCKDEDFFALSAFYVDIDDDVTSVAKECYKRRGCPPTAVVVTGRSPHIRAQMLWRVETPERDPEACRRQNLVLAEALGGDTSVVNAGRVMRLGGSIAWPVKPGRVVERTELRLFNDGRPQSYLSEQIQKAFSPAPERHDPEGAEPLGGLNIGDGKEGDKALLAKIRSGDEWHNNLLRLIGRWVEKGATDDLMLSVAESVTLPGFTVDQTRKDMQAMINGARRKGFAGETICDEEEGDGLKILTAGEFIDQFVAPDYIVDGMIQRGQLYSVTGPTGHGKTSILITFAVCMAAGLPFGMHETEKGRVVFLAGENPDDVRARLIMTAESMDIDSSTVDVCFAPHVFDIAAKRDGIAAEIARIGGAQCIIVDTAAAFFMGDDENSNTQLGQFARSLRQALCTLPTKPAVMVAAHPVKSATRGSLDPRGGGAFIAEVDGNLTVWNSGDGAAELHHTKIRGPGFEPSFFDLEKRTSDRVRDAKGRSIPSVVAAPMDETAINDAHSQARSDEDCMFDMLLQWPNDSFATWCERLGWFTGELNAPAKSRVARTLGRLKNDGFVKKVRDRWVLTSAGKAEAQKSTGVKWG